MKKIRITVNKGSKGKKFPVFNSPESLYVWLYDEEIRASNKLDPSLGTMIHLRPGEVMEVEWMGCEYIYEEDGLKARADLVRLAKTMQVKTISTKKLVGIYGGWTTDSIVRFKSEKSEDVRVTRLTTKSKHRFNIDELFDSHGMSEPELDDDMDSEKSKVLH